MAGSSRASRDTTINLRTTRQQLSLIDRAAATVGKNRSDFIFEVVGRAAESVLLDQCFFHLDPIEFKKFSAALDRTPADNPRLRKLLTTKAPWE